MCSPVFSSVQCFGELKIECRPCLSFYHLSECYVENGQGQVEKKRLIL